MIHLPPPLLPPPASNTTDKVATSQTAVTWLKKRKQLVAADALLAAQLSLQSTHDQGIESALDECMRLTDRALARQGWAVPIEFSAAGSCAYYSAAYCTAMHTPMTAPMTVRAGMALRTQVHEELRRNREHYRLFLWQSALAPNTVKVTKPDTGQVKVTVSILAEKTVTVTETTTIQQDAQQREHGSYGLSD